MSRIGEIQGGFHKLQKNLPAILIEYIDEIDLAPARLSLRGKLMEESQKDQSAWPIVYANIKHELDSIAKYLTMEIDRIRSILFRRYTDNHTRTLSDRTIDKYIDSEVEYLNYQELYLEVKELHDKATSVCDAFTTRGFALRDITTIRVNQLHNTVL